MIPENVKKRMKIGGINKRGSKAVEKKLRHQKKNYASNLRKKRVETRYDKDLEAFQELATEKTTEHAKLWPMKAAREKNEIMHKMLTKTWWSKVPARSVSDEIMRVMPSMKRHSTDIVNKSKKHIMAANHLFGEHSKAVKAAAKAAAKKLDAQEKTIKVDGDDLAGLTGNKILKKYVNSELSQHHSTSESANMRSRTNLMHCSNCLRGLNWLSRPVSHL